MVLSRRLIKMSSAVLSASKCRWAFDISRWEPTQDDWSKSMQKIQPDERDKVRRFRYQLDAKASLVGRLFMQKWATAFLGKQVLFERTERGRPISPDPAWDLNVSHQGNFTVFAADRLEVADQAGTVKIGVDVMRLSDARLVTPEKRREFFRLMRRQFTDAEWRQIIGDVVSKNDVDDDDDVVGRRQLADFYRHWSLKESFVKATGSGLTVDLQKISFKVTSPLIKDAVVVDSRVSVDGDDGTGWSFEESLLDDDHCVAVASYRLGQEVVNPIPPKFHHFSEICDVLEDLLPFDYTSGEDDWLDFSSKNPVKPF